MRCNPPQTKQRRFCPAPKYSWDVYNAMARPEDQLPKNPYIIEAPKQTYANAASKGMGRRSKNSSEGSAVFSSQFGNSSHSTSNEPQLSDAERWALEVAPVKIPALPVRRRCRDRARANATFPRFSEIPAELRNKIWHMAFNDHSQTVRLAWRWDDEHEGNYYGSRLDPLCRAPELLQVCKEARDIGLGHYYRQSFGTMQSRPKTWFNFENDKIFLQTRSALQLVNTAKQIIRRERQLIKGLMLPLRDFVHNPDVSSRSLPASLTCGRSALLLPSTPRTNTGLRIKNWQIRLRRQLRLVGPDARRSIDLRISSRSLLSAESSSIRWWPSAVALMVSSGAQMFVMIRGFGTRLAVSNFEVFHTGDFDPVIHLPT